MIKVMHYNYIWDTSKPKTHEDDLQKSIEELMKLGWDPWAMTVDSAFNTNYTECHYFYQVWFKRWPK